jgi:8-amino-7-oxononanoate synthase
MARAPDGNPVRAHVRALDALARRGRYRTLSPIAGLDFTSNDYLALAGSSDLAAAARDALDRGVPMGAGGSRLLRGNHPEHEALEHEAAAFFGSQAALYFGGGFSANAALIATLPARGDLIVHDAFVHASAWEGMAQTKAACVSVRHNDVAAFGEAIVAFRKAGGRGRIWIAVESLYSMDGDVAPLTDLVALADVHDAMLLIDEAHATGVLGCGGRGLGAGLEGRDNVIGLHTCGKALGASGALITAPTSIRDFLVNRARAFIYATAPSPVMAAVVRRALALVASEPERRTELARRVAFAGAELRRTCGLDASGTHIMPVVVGSDHRAVALAATLQRTGFDVRAIRPPTVPEGSARLRITLTLNTTELQITALLETLAEALAEHGAVAVAPTIARRRADVAIGPPRFVVSGTGTGVGKTVFAGALTAALDGDYWKPVQAGLDGETDTACVKRLSGLPEDRCHAEAYRLATPVSPHAAAEIDGVVIQPDALTPPQTARALIIEGAGGLMVPLTADTLFIDVFARWQIPVILVASTALGTINHTLLSLEALRARQVPILGVAFVGPSNHASQSALAALANVRILGRLPHIDPLTPEALAAAFAANFTLADFVCSPFGAAS